MKRAFLLLVLAAHVAFGQQAQDTSPVLRPDSLHKKPARVFVSYIPPLVFFAYGATALGNNALNRLDRFVYHDKQEDFPNFSTKADNYLQFAPAAAVYALNLAGIKGKHNFGERTVLYVMSNVLMAGSVYVLKHSTHQLRPDGSDDLSFPSGHTATAFAAAEFMYQEYTDVSPWYGIAGYAMATATGVLRVYNNDHWFSNIVAGAGIGILSTKISYLVYPWIKKKFGSSRPQSALVMPSWQNGAPGLAYVKQL